MAGTEPWRDSAPGKDGQRGDGSLLPKMTNPVKGRGGAGDQGVTRPLPMALTGPLLEPVHATIYGRWPHGPEWRSGRFSLDSPQVRGSLIPEMPASDSQPAGASLGNSHQEQNEGASSGRSGPWRHFRQGLRLSRLASLRCEFLLHDRFPQSGRSTATWGCDPPRRPRSPRPAQRLLAHRRGRLHRLQHLPQIRQGQGAGSRSAGRAVHGPGGTAIRLRAGAR